MFPQYAHNFSLDVVKYFAILKEPLIHVKMTHQLLWNQGWWHSTNKLSTDMLPYITFLIYLSCAKPVIWYGFMLFLLSFGFHYIADICDTLCFTLNYFSQVTSLLARSDSAHEGDRSIFDNLWRQTILIGVSILIFFVVQRPL